MVKLVLADRDSTERIGIRWFIEAYHLPFREIVEAETAEQLLQLIINHQPQAVYIELEMIPNHLFSKIKDAVLSHDCHVICTTAEPVFERAVQAIDLQARSLLVKPISPDKLKGILSQIGIKKALFSKEGQQNREEFDLYRALFMDHGDRWPGYSFLLLKLECPEYQKECFAWLNRRFSPYSIHIFPLSESIMCFLESKQLSNDSLLFEECQRLLDEWASKDMGRMSVAVYPSYSPHTSINQMYEQAKEMLQMEFYKGYQQIYIADGKITYCEVDPFLKPAEQRLWLSMLEKKDKQGIKQWLYQAFTTFPTELPRPDLMRIKLTSVLAQLRRYMFTYKLNEELATEEKYHQVFQCILYERVLFRIVQELVLFTFQLLDGAEAKERAETYDTVEKCFQFIEANYTHHDFTLDQLAKAVNRSPSYISSLLSNKKQQTFRQIVTECRIQRGRKLLRETDLTVQEIAYDIGFSDPNYFSRLFKKQEGVTPSQYRSMDKEKY